MHSIHPEPRERPFELSELGAIALTHADDPREKLSERAYAALKNEILSGRMPAGTTLTEARVAEELAMSRTPVRQALRVLRQEGLVVEAGHRRQVVVRGIPPEQRREVFLVREALERISVTEACRFITPEDADLLRVIVARQRRAVDAGDKEKYINLDEQLHFSIARSARLPLVLKVLTELRALIRLMGIQAAGQPGRMTRVIEEHLAIIDALERRDAPGAVAAVAAHLRATERALEEQGDEAGGSKQGSDPGAVRHVEPDKS